MESEVLLLQQNNLQSNLSYQVNMESKYNICNGVEGAENRNTQVKVP